MNEDIKTTKEELKETLKEVLKESYRSDDFKEAVESTFEGQKFKGSVEEVVMGAIANFNTYDLKPQFDDIKTDLQNMKGDLQNVKTTMVTKSFMTEKINDLKGEFVVKFKKEDEKVENITDKLGDKKIFNSKDVEEIKSIDVFAKAV